MERKAFKKRIIRRFQERLLVMFDRNEEYAEEEDALADFKRIAAICKIWKVDVTKSEDCPLFFRIAKIDRERNLQLLGKNLKDKRLSDAFLDDLNYLDLQEALIEEVYGEPSG